MTFLILIIILALIFDYINGFHDAAISIATIVSTKVLTPFQAVLWAAIFNFAAFFILKYFIGEFRIGNTIANFVSRDFITLPVIFAGLIAAIAWNLFRKSNPYRAESWFRRLQLISSALLSLGHGGNDAQKVLGIIAAAMVAHGDLDTIQHLPNWVPAACFTAIALGTMSGGWRIVKTMGTRITKVSPLEGVSAETAGAITLFLTQALGIPVSTTHTITGAIIGVGATKRLSAVRWGVTINLIWAWLLTIPVSGMLAALVYWLMQLFM